MTQFLTPSTQALYFSLTGLRQLPNMPALGNGSWLPKAAPCTSRPCKTTYLALLRSIVSTMAVRNLALRYVCWCRMERHQRCLTLKKLQRRGEQRARLSNLQLKLQLRRRLVRLAQQMLTSWKLLCQRGGQRRELQQHKKVP